MLVFPAAKINLGLHVVNKRSDGYHNIETVFYPLAWNDALEVLPAGEGQAPFDLQATGLPIAGPIEENLLFKAWKLINGYQECPPLRIHLHKHIPMGAGLGGGSADAAFFINAANEKFQLGLSLENKLAIAAQLGADCAFFIASSPVLASGRGDVFSPIRVDLSGYYILAVYPGIHSNTREAYEGLVPARPAVDLKAVVSGPVSSWKGFLVNDFEASLFKKYPEIQSLKDQLYARGALYASMSGSGSSVFGIFEQAPDLHFPPSYTYCLQKPAAAIL